MQNCEVEIEELQESITNSTLTKAREEEELKILGRERGNRKKRAKKQATVNGVMYHTGKNNRRGRLGSSHHKRTAS